MNLKILKCPSCDGKMIISELTCPKCALQVKKELLPCDFCQLPEDEYEFLKIFLRTQGKITDIEKIIGASYPTIKAKIDKLLQSLRLAPIAEKYDPIEALSRGEISVDEAVAILKQRRKR